MSQDEFKDRLGNLYKVTILAMDQGTYIVRADDKVVGVRTFRRITTKLTRSKTTAGEGRQELVDVHGINLWTERPEDTTEIQLNNDPRREFYILGQDKSQKDIRKLLDEVYGMKTDGVIMIERFWRNAGTVHIG